MSDTISDTTSTPLPTPSPTTNPDTTTPIINTDTTPTPNRVIIYENPEDPMRVCIMTPTGELSIEELLQRHIDRTRLYMVCDPSTLTLDPEFMDAWTLLSFPPSNDPTLSVHMPNARNLWRNKLRRERAALLPTLDVDYIRAMEENDASRMESIAAQKRKLRDMPRDPRIEAATTTEALKQLTLDVLLLQ